MAAFASVLTLAVSVDARAQDDDEPGDLTLGTELEPAGVVEGAKAPTSNLAQTDPALLGRTDSTPVEVVVKLDYDSVATYEGTIDGLAATSPAVTGDDLSGTSAAETAYTDYVVDQENAFLDELAAVAPSAQVGQSLRTVYGGVALTIPANTVDEVLAIPNVVAVQQDLLRQPTTDASADFIRAVNLYPDLGGVTNAGKGVIFGVLDSGAWPEHPSLADQGNLSAPPPKADGTPRVCNFGDNPLTPANDPFACTNKLIGGQPFLATYLSSPARAAAEPFHTARDSNGHGTHTGTTTAGNALASAPVLGVDRGPLHGIAPGAWVSVYKVCGISGCFGSDSAAAVQQAIKDGVKVINFSISGGESPYTDPAELAFLDAYAAGVFVSTSAGNDGPGASTANHLSPWVTSVAASTQEREFQSTLTVTGAGGATFTTVGASITAGAGPLPVVLSSAPPYNNNLCDAPAPPGIFVGKIVACQRGVNARVEKGFNVLQGGAAGMILYNPTLADIETDNHWLPTVHLADGTAFKAFIAANPGATASFTAGTKANGQGDVMAAFSSRGPAGLVIKPDISAPGVQILAGHTPFREAIVNGPPGEYFQAIAGTSMSSPHIAGSAVLMKALHPDWTPMEIRSALMTTATTQVVKEDGTTEADPFDMGAGRVDLAYAEQTGLVMDETAENMFALGGDPVNAVHLNIPSINAPVFGGELTTTRTFTNVTGRRVRWDTSAWTPSETTITITPRRFTLEPGASIDLEITLESTLTSGQHFAEIKLVPNRAGVAWQHLPVAFAPQAGDVTLMQECEPTQIYIREDTTCTVTAQNYSFREAEVSIESRVTNQLRIREADGATITSNRSVEAEATLFPAELGVPTVNPGNSIGYLPLDAFGVTPDAIGDEEIINYDVPQFEFNGETYNQIGVDSNGYLIAGGGSAEDNNCCNLPAGASPARPNNLLAPFWTDLDGTGTPGIFAATLTDGVNTWLVIEHRVNVFGTTSRRTFQVWIGIDGVQDITFAYAAAQTDPAGQDYLVGAENASGVGDVTRFLPAADQRVTSTDPSPGGSFTYEFTARGVNLGDGLVRSRMSTDLVPGITVEDTQVSVYPR